jgi:hypothetical protein
LAFDWGWWHCFDWGWWHCFDWGWVLLQLVLFFLRLGLVALR